MFFNNYNKKVSIVSLMTWCDTSVHNSADSLDLQQSVITWQERSLASKLPKKKKLGKLIVKDHI